ncbi:IS21-like element helper ATPase IstB [Haliscomenobacter hydrossis]|uniref:IstB domain protein ATP-binding protein n=1 Tax=Haliscomenobacter hydrossis (strain ATCC 27775 / DSM 1100 / LMG 10767 / O) TaxID=760192 RepID=F4KU41_HALH1|nr:IS21-like element helper ATPase IstB [Haliscomenobacter hydrossis]AEE48392.1 IstB domain protein ATP-binding protein [Haliscomenobacter hydrossis DSM 1100]AEE50138.1 IstB domain protein ATP-binding protein [Haliscomenobacter hydrossis DSM 1100]
MQQLENKLKYLRMSAVLQSLKNHNDTAQEQQLSYLEFFEMLIEDECAKRKANVLRQRLAKSKLNTQKSFEHYDLNFQPELDKKMLSEIRSCRFIDEHKNIILIGKPGTGKTHLANAIGLEAAARGYSVLFTHLHTLLEKLAQGRIDSSHRRTLQQILAPDLLILDEIGFRSLAPQALDDFFEIIRHRYEHKSTIFTSNRNFEDWGAILGDKVMASAIIDRIVHHAHILKFNGDSFRIKDFLAHLDNSI